MLHINGNPPPLDDAVLQGLICVEHWHKGELDDPANMVYLCADGQWHKLYFEARTVFWRSRGDAPAATSAVATRDEPFVNLDLGSKLGLNGRRIESWDVEPLGQRSLRLELRFQGGGSLVFDSDGEVTSYGHPGLGEHSPEP